MYSVGFMMEVLTSITQYRFIIIRIITYIKKNSKGSFDDFKMLLVYLQMYYIEM